MRELGLGLSWEFPKPLADEVVRAADVVVTMGCGDACPLYPFKKYEDWSIEDPAGQPLEKVRAIRARRTAPGRTGRLGRAIGAAVETGQQGGEAK